MAESINSSLRSIHRVVVSESSVEGVKASLITPWSSRESFTKEVCGLPSTESGCWRHRIKSDGESFYRGVGPCVIAPADETACADWIIFSRSVDRDDCRVEYFSDIRPSPRKGFHEAIFGFQKGALSKRKIPAPNYLAYHTFPLDADTPIPITNWLEEHDGSAKGLCDYFGRHTFIPKNINTLNLKLSISDLINAYLDDRCKFRRIFGRGLGITKCKVGVGLYEEEVLQSCAISFTYVAPDTREIRKLDEMGLGALRLDVPETVRDAFNEHTYPITVAEDETRIRSDEINFADCLSGYGRQHVLPTEVDRAFLCFPMGEITTYLLHWLLLRIFAYDNNQNKEFIKRFRRWGKALEERHHEHQQLFIALLEMPVSLYVDTNTFKETALQIEGKEHYLGLFEGSRPFGTILRTVAMSLTSVDEREDIPLSAIKFLRQFFSETIPFKNDFRALPMYRKLGWRKPPDLESLSSLEIADDTDLSYEQRLTLIERVLYTFINASGLNAKSDGAAQARKELTKHVRRSVFPISHVLTHWPCGQKVTHAFIFPLWEDTIHNWHRPVVFAHAFIRIQRRTQFEEVLKFGTKLHRLLMPLGQAIAHFYYNQLQKGVTDSKAKIMLMGGIVHSAGNALRMANADTLIQLLSAEGRLGGTGLPEQVLDEFKIGYHSTRALLGLMEIITRPGPLQRKFQSEHSYYLDTCLKEAEAMVAAHQRGSSVLAHLHLRRDTMWVNAQFPSGYIDQMYIQVLLYELLLNVSKYGRRFGEDGRHFTEALVGCRLEGKRLEIHVRNALHPADETIEWADDREIAVPRHKESGPYRSHGFLKFMQALPAYIPGIKITGKRERFNNNYFYHSALTLEQIVIERDGKYVKVTPAL